MKFQASRLCLGGVLPDPRISRMAPGHARRGGCASTRPLLCVPIFGRWGQSVCFVFLWVPAFAKGVNGVLCFSLGSRLRGNDVGVRGNDVGRDESPGRYLVRSLRVNDLGFAPPP